MTATRLSGITFSENTTTIPAGNEDITDAPLFIIQTSTTLATLDEEFVEFNQYSDLHSIIGSIEGLAMTRKVLKQTIDESNIGKFYVYSIKTDTKAAFKEAVIASAHLYDCESIIYIEQSKSTGSNTIANKVDGIKEGVRDNFAGGLFRQAYIVPYGTYRDAITGDNIVPATAAVTCLTGITNGISDGLVCVVAPDSMCGSLLGATLNTPFDEEIGKYTIVNVDTSAFIDYNATQMLSLQNGGILFIRPEIYRGEKSYKPNVGVTLSYQTSQSDGKLIRRRIVNEVLRRIKEESRAFLLDKDIESVRSSLDSAIGGVINEFVLNDCILRDGTKLSVTMAGDTFQVSGTIKPIDSVYAIDVALTIQ